MGGTERADGRETLSEALSRVRGLEERIAHGERVQDELSDMVRAQQAAIRRLLDVVERLEAALDGGTPIDQPPPHY